MAEYYDFVGGVALRQILPFKFIGPIFVILFTVACSDAASDTPWSSNSIYTGIGSTLSLHGKSEVCCGSDYQYTKHRYIVNIRNTSLPWGTQVFLHYGFKKIELDVDAGNGAQDWQVSGWAPFVAVAPYEWRIELSQTSHVAGQSHRLSDLQFVIKIVYPDGGEMFERGSESNLGFFEGKDPAHSSSCRERERDPNGWCQMRIHQVERS